jgi:hypothetical protein
MSICNFDDDAVAVLQIMSDGSSKVAILQPFDQSLCNEGKFLMAIMHKIDTDKEWVGEMIAYFDEHMIAQDVMLEGTPKPRTN